MNSNSKDLSFYKKNGYLIKKNLLQIKKINKINNLVKKIISLEKNKKKKHFVSIYQLQKNQSI